jgi:hypothetical protein
MLANTRDFSGDQEMRTQLSPVVLVVVGLFACLSLVGLAQDKTSPEAYSGVAMGTGGSVGGKSIQFDFRISQYTTDEEVQKFAELVKEQGTDALRRALEKEDKGRISPVGSKGEGTGQIMAAAKIRFDKKKGKYEIESFGNQYIKATNVRPWK